MNNFTFVLLLVAIVAFARIVRSYIESRKQRDDGGEEMAATLARIEALEERVEVMERIVTEEPYDLKKQIDDL